ncbi:MAG: DinB family protein [SAR202 cluster bacterium]|nr:DinB family protein [SAR202 cluster bacterium]
MHRSTLVGLVVEAWKDLDRAVAGLSAEDAVKRHAGGSSFAWTLAHVTHQVDVWVNVRFAKHPPHPVVAQDRFRFGGTGDASEWEAIQQGVKEVRERALAYLADKSDEDLEATVPYTGSHVRLRELGALSLRYALYRAVSHHYFHIGEVASKRDALGHKVGDYPGTLEESI